MIFPIIQICHLICHGYVSFTLSPLLPHFPIHFHSLASQDRSINGTSRFSFNSVFNKFQNDSPDPTSTTQPQLLWLRPPSSFMDQFQWVQFQLVKRVVVSLVKQDPGSLNLAKRKNLPMGGSSFFLYSQDVYFLGKPHPDTASAPSLSSLQIRMWTWRISYASSEYS